MKMFQLTIVQRCSAGMLLHPAQWLQQCTKEFVEHYKTALLVFVLPTYLLWTPLLQKRRVPSRIYTYQSHAPLSKGGRPCTLKPHNNERIEGQISITLSIALALNCSYWPGEKSFPHISIVTHTHMESTFLSVGSTGKVKVRSHWKRN